MSETNETPEVDVELQNVETFARSNPGNLPPQYNGDPEKFIKSWKDMRAEITRLQQAGKSKPSVETEQVTQSTPVAAPSSLVVPNKTEAPKPTEDEWNKWGHEIHTTGSITAETKNQIKARFGIPDQVVDAYIDGIKARQRQLADEASKIVGGPNELNSIIKWATDNLDDAEREAVNNGLKSPGWQNVILGLKARRESANPEPKTRIAASSGVPAGIKPFATSKEMVAAMRDPRYKYDSEYQQMVQDRVRASGTMKYDG
jgi:hypothetical protein